MNPENHNPSAELEFRPAQINDVPAILKIVNYYIEHSNSIYEETPRILEDQLQWFLQLQKQNFPVIVAVSDMQVVGYASFQTFRTKFGYRFSAEHSVYVSPGFGGYGIGFNLMQLLINEAIDRGIHVLIGGIDSQNTDSIKFHRRLGFQEVGRMREVGKKHDQWLTLVWMQKILSPKAV